MSPDCMTVHLTVLEAYETRTGFMGIGKFFEQRGLLRIVGGDEPCEE